MRRLKKLLKAGLKLLAGVALLLIVGKLINIAWVGVQMLPLWLVGSLAIASVPVAIAIFIYQVITSEPDTSRFRNL